MTMRISILLVVLMWALGGTSIAYAHAALDRANPRVGSTVASAPRTVSLWFTENIEPALSSIEVLNAAGARVDQGRARGGGNTLTIGLKALSAGTYQVHWRVLSVDTHRTEGTFSFQVGQ
jgi:methionine-rich copper-binding protein CopC